MVEKDLNEVEVVVEEKTRVEVEVVVEEKTRVEVEVVVEEKTGVEVEVVVEERMRDGMKMEACYVPLQLPQLTSTHPLT